MTHGCESGFGLAGSEPRGRAVLHADLSVLPLSAVLEALHETERSGRLAFRFRDQAKQVWFRRGEIVFADSNQPLDRLGECLLRAGLISPQQLEAAESRYRPPGRFGKVLVELGVLTPRELWSGVRHQVEEIVRSLFATPAGNVVFYDGPDEPENVLRLSLPTRRLVEEGLRRREELQAFLAVLEDPRVRLEPGARSREPLSRDERALVAAIGDGAGFARVRELTGLEPEAGARCVQLLRLIGALRLVRDDGLAAPAIPEPEERAVAATKRMACLAAAIAEVEGAGPIGERLERIVAEVTSRFPALLTGVRPGRGGVLDPGLLAERARRLPGGGDHLDDALCEILAYLEFEVRNHPGLAEPEAVLREAASLS